MRGASLLLTALVLSTLGACRTTSTGRADRAVTTTPVISEATLVAFTLPASDTLKAGEERDGLEEFRGYTAMVVPLLAGEDVVFQATTADSIIIERPDGIRRVVMLGGLDYPYGYVLIEPGYAETILTGVLTDSELVDEVNWYFGTAEESDGEGPPRRMTMRVPTSPPAELVPGLPG
jgi:hypothetical protein